MPKDTPTRARNLGIAIGRMAPGPRNAITDVAGVRVGHETLAEGDTQTGVTAILPHGGALFSRKCTAAVHVINGFGKSVGLMQIAEMGVIESPIVLTNTFGVGAGFDGVVDHMLREDPRIGLSTGTVNPVVCECNDGHLNAIRTRAITPAHVARAIADARADMVEGAVGAGRGMSCYTLKGGIGTASRRFACQGRDATLGALVLTNMGALEDLIVDLEPAGHIIAFLAAAARVPDRGSIIIVLATDMPLSARQLERVARRASVGIARTGSFIGNGSGEIALAFTTADPVPHAAPEVMQTAPRVHEDLMDEFFRAAAETVEEAILNSMLMAETVTGRDGNTRLSLSRYAHLLTPPRA